MANEVEWLKETLTLMILMTEKFKMCNKVTERVHLLCTMGKNPAKKSVHLILVPKLTLLIVPLALTLSLVIYPCIIF